MHFYIQLATVNKFTYCVIWYFNISLSPLRVYVVVVIFSSVNYSVDGFFSPSYIHCTAMRSVCVWQRRQPQLLGGEREGDPQSACKKSSKTLGWSFLWNYFKPTKKNWREQQIMIFVSVKHVHAKWNVQLHGFVSKSRKNVIPHTEQAPVPLEYFIWRECSAYNSFIIIRCAITTVNNNIES